MRHQLDLPRGAIFVEQLAHTVLFLMRQIVGGLEDDVLERRRQRYPIGNHVSGLCMNMQDVDMRTEFLADREREAEDALALAVPPDRGDD